MWRTEDFDASADAAQLCVTTLGDEIPASSIAYCPLKLLNSMSSPSSVMLPAEV